MPRVAIIDDNLKWREKLVKFFEGRDCQVQQFSQSDEVEKLLDEKSFDFEIVVLNLQLTTDVENLYEDWDQLLDLLKTRPRTPCQVVVASSARTASVDWMSVYKAGRDRVAAWLNKEKDKDTDGFETIFRPLLEEFRSSNGEDKDQHRMDYTIEYGTVNLKPIYNGKIKIAQDDKDLLVTIMANFAIENDGREYYEILLKNSRLPPEWIPAALGRIRDNTETSASNIIDWALQQGKNPHNPRWTILGDILKTFYRRIGPDDQKFILALISGYHLCEDQATLLELPIPWRMETTSKDYKGFGPEFDWQLNLADDKEYQSWFRPIPDYQDVGFLKRVIAHTALVCHIEIVGKARFGTGVLIKPNEVLTTFHTFTPNNGNVRETNLQVKLRFNHYSGQEEESEILVELNVDDAISYESPTSELDFVILRLPKNQNQEGALKVNHLPQRQGGLNILQHPMGETLKLAVGLTSDTVSYVDDGSGKFQYLTRTSKGSSGAPCFDDEGNFVGIHHAERLRPFGTIREGILYSTILRKISP
jgi:CheY-like chemotaxis protein